MRWWLTSAAAAVVVIGVGAVLGARRIAPPPPARPSATVWLTSGARRAGCAELVQLARDGLTRRAEKMTLRVRNISCEGVALGSAWAIDGAPLVTNRATCLPAPRS